MSGDAPQPRNSVDDEARAQKLVDIASDLARELHPDSRPARRPDIHSHLERDWDFDSLGRMELLLRIQRAFGVTIPEHWLNEAESLGQLMPVIGQAKPMGMPDKRQWAPPIALSTVFLPIDATTLTEVLDRHAEENGNRVHAILLADDGAEAVLKYRDLARRARRAAVQLRRFGLEPGSRVALMLPTGVDFFVTFFAILYAGGVPTPLYPPARASQIEEHLRRQAGILENAGAEILVAGRNIHAAARLLQLRVPSLRHVTSPDALLTSDVDAAGQPEARREPHATALLQYTSGSTGDPKGVVLSHVNLLANIRAMGVSLDARPSDVYVSWLPLYHDMGLIGAWLGSLYFAVPLVIMSPLSFLVRPARWLWAIHRYRGTLSAVPNFAFELCIRRIENAELKDLDLGSLRLIANGAEPVIADTLRRFASRFGPYGFRADAMAPVYGLAENAVGLTFPPLGRSPVIDRVYRDALAQRGTATPAPSDDAAAIEFVSCGRPLPHHEIRVVDANGEVADRREGRIQFRGPSATSGYFRNDAKNRQLFEDGWLNTGDLGYIADGELFVTGRAKDIVIRAGRHIYPVELEEAVGNVGGIRKGCVAVFGSRATGAGTERLIVIAESRASSPAAMMILRKSIEEALVRLLDAPADDIVVVPPHTVPKTSSGKLRRTAMRELYEKGRLTAISRPVPWQMTRLLAAAFVARMRLAAAGAAERLYGWYCWSVIGAMAAIAWPGVVLLPRRTWRWVFLRTIVRAAFCLMRMDIHVVVAQPLPARAVFVSNHASYIDGLVLISVLPGDPAFVAKRELSDQIFAGLLLRALGACFVERSDPEGGVADVRHTQAVAAAGRSLIFFPEGTFTRAQGLQPFRLGAFLVAAEGPLPAVPIAIRGTRFILRSDQWRIRRGEIFVEIAAPITPTGKDFASAVALRDEVRRAILARCGEPDLTAPLDIA